MEFSAHLWLSLPIALIVLVGPLVVVVVVVVVVHVVVVVVVVLSVVVGMVSYDAF